MCQGSVIVPVQEEKGEGEDQQDEQDDYPTPYHTDL
jgi:hypothetical protein